MNVLSDAEYDKLMELLINLDIHGEDYCFRDVIDYVKELIQKERNHWARVTRLDAQCVHK